MMKGRPRTHKLNVANLYCKLDKRSGTVYYQYRDQRTGRFRGLGNDKSRAIAVAKELNELILKQLVEQYSHLLDSNPVRTEHKGISTKAWCERYLEIQFERLAEEEITIHTVKTRKSAVKVLIERCQTIGVKELDTKTLATILDEYKKARKFRMAQVLRSVWIDVFKEAQQAGEVSSGYNPALATKSPKVKVQRARLAESDWQPIFESACQSEPKYTSHAMMISLTTSLRREDVCAIEFTHIKNGHLHVATSKSGGETKLAFPLELTNPLIGISLGEILSLCRQTNVLSRYAIHHTKAIQGVKPGDRVNVNTVTRHFAKARDNTTLKWEGTPPSFHELRSLSERTYGKVGIDTQALLGHKSRRTTDKYADLRGSAYVVVGKLKATNS